VPGLQYVVSVLLLVAFVAAVVRLRQYRAKFEGRGLLLPWPIEKVAAGEVDDVLAPGELGPKVEAETIFLPAINVLGGISDRETWVLCAIAGKSRLIFEFGTCTGKTTYLLARNAPADARVVTLTLAPEQAPAYADVAGDAGRDRRAALEESAFTEFFYTGSPVEGRITQLFGDSKAFDESEYAGQCDMIFVDGSHAASYVESDSRKALRMVKPGGLIFWHDYRGPGRAPGVFRTLNKLAKELPLTHIEGTTLVCYRAPSK
jgi:predicted O-methyltransferase YrrM